MEYQLFAREQTRPSPNYTNCLEGWIDNEGILLLLFYKADLVVFYTFKNPLLTNYLLHGKYYSGHWECRVDENMVPATCSREEV